MPRKNSLNINKIINWSLFLIFAAFCIIWVYQSYQFTAFKFLEEVQLFRTDPIYIQSYLSQPAGISSLIGSFFTQLYYYPILGAVIYTVALLIIYLILLKTFSHYGNIYHLFALSFIIPLILLFVYNSENTMHFHLAHLIGLIFSLAAFLLYLKLNKKIQYAGGIILYLIVYYIAGGNAILYAALLILNELFNKNKSYLFIVTLIILGGLIPFLSQKFIYLVSVKNAYLALTPFYGKYLNNIYIAAWILIPILLLIWIPITKKIYKLDKQNPLIISILNALVLMGIAIYGINSYNKNENKKEMEHILEMAYYIEVGNWDKVIELGKVDLHFSNPVPISYFLNIAHLAKGDLPSQIFNYRQTGSYGLFNSWRLHYTTDIFIGELYYRLGLIPVAEQCAFEAMISSPYEHSSKALRRIVQTNMLKKDTRSFEKYIRLFEKSPVYKKWAKEQREHYNLYLKNPEYKIPGFPEMLNTDYNFFFSSGKQEYNMFGILKADPANKKAFEYLACFYLLSKDLLSFEALLNDYYDNMNYEKIPLFFEEALIILGYNGKEELLHKYEVRAETVTRFNSLNQSISRAGNSKKALEATKEKYKKTYWYYYQYVKPMLLENVQDKIVY